MPHPYFVPVRLRRSLRAQRSGMSGSASTACGVPLIVRFTMSCSVTDVSLGSSLRCGFEEARRVTEIRLHHQPALTARPCNPMRVPATSRPAARKVVRLAMPDYMVLSHELRSGVYEC